MAPELPTIKPQAEIDIELRAAGTFVPDPAPSTVAHNPDATLQMPTKRGWNFPKISLREYVNAIVFGLALGVGMQVPDHGGASRGERGTESARAELTIEQIIDNAVLRLETDPRSVVNEMTKLLERPNLTLIQRRGILLKRGAAYLNLNEDKEALADFDEVLKKK